MADLEKIFSRKLAALFPREDLRAEAMAILHDIADARVRLALFKISGSNIEALRHNSNQAKEDFRDILVTAENRRANRLFGRKITSERRAEAEKLDREDYEKWLST